MTDNSGLKVGIGMSAIGVTSLYTTKRMADFMALKTARYVRNVNRENPADVKRLTPLRKAASEMFDMRKSVKGLNILKSFAIATSIYLGCGAIVDFANRKQRAKLEPNATTDKGNKYTKVNMGKKLGAILGLTAYGVSGLANKKLVIKILQNSHRIKAIANIALYGALGGFALGTLTDEISNNKAAKNADKAAIA